MPEMTESLLKRNLYTVFNERDAEKRRAAIANIWTADGVFIDLDGPHHGQAELDETAASLHDQFPGYLFTLLGPIQAFHGVGRFSWAFGPPSEPMNITGMDVGVVTGGRMSALYTFIDPPKDD
jgi:hypothetical protein